MFVWSLGASCREQQALVLSIAGDWQRPLMAPTVQPMPRNWLPGNSEAAAEAGNGADATSTPPPNGYANGCADAWAHADSLEAAQALLEQLETTQLLQELLRPEGSSTAAAPRTATAWPEKVGSCSRLVVTGHGLGAGAAALLALKLQAWQLGEPGWLA
jgi:hypothetical protein